MLAGGYLLKAQCMEPWDGRQYARLCYNDIQPLWANRGVAERTFPYVNGGLSEQGELTGAAIEYPVLSGLFMWGSGAFADDVNTYLWHSALLLAPFGMAVAYLLARIAGWRALLWAGAPALVLYAFHNWDLLVVAAAVAGFYLWHRGRPMAAAVAFGIGAALKLYPGFFLVPLALAQWVSTDRRASARCLAAGLGSFAVVNLPFALAGFEGWSATYTFHSVRGPDWNSIWIWLSGADVGGWTLPFIGTPVLNVLVGVLTAASFAVALLVGLRRWRDEGRYPFVQVCAAMLAAFLVWNKVHSPQYALWLLPFFVLIGVRLWWWAAYSVVDLIVYVGIFRWFYDYTYQGHDLTFAKRALIFGIWARAAILAAMFVLFLRSRAAGREPPAPAPAGVTGRAARAIRSPVG
jgi:uncharacterized membrane protein